MLSKQFIIGAVLLLVGVLMITAVCNDDRWDMKAILKVLLGTVIASVGLAFIIAPKVLLT